MVKKTAELAHGSRSSGFSSRKQQFLSGSIADMYERPVSKKTVDSDSENEDVHLKEVFKEIEQFAASNAPWKDRKQLENKKVVSLGGKPVKKHRTPLSVAKPAMKNQKKREQKQMEEDLIIGRFTRKSSRTEQKLKSRPEDRVLRASEGHFKKGVLNVKHLLAPPKSNTNFGSQETMNNGKSKGKGKGRGKGKGKNMGKNKKQRKGR